MPFAQQLEKDRRSRMAISSMNQPAKKSGNGSFGWGAAAEFGPDDVQTCFPREAVLAPCKVFVAPASSSCEDVETATMQSFETMPEVMDTKEFPSLSIQAAVQQPRVWGPVKEETLASLPDPAPSVESCLPPASFPEAQARSSSVGLFDAQHPRNQFARKPRRTAPSQEASEETVEDGFVLVDWSSAGTTGVSGAILKQSGNTAHLSPYVKPEPPVALSVLKQLAEQCAIKQVQQRPQNCRHSATCKRNGSRQPRARCR
eukprot:TRINITY_DN77124_c0_g1_i1.p1 TRINITY_DN77124_c0_g1~~TRINITY_DN77124_c0_g1_i1.p1  ORF type:complete len:259 (+),score=57.78 TRINITY_DN77124_c0_g1_i1:53-829(+)